MPACADHTISHNLEINHSKLANGTVMTQALLTEAAAQRLLHASTRIWRCAHRPRPRWPIAATLEAHSPFPTVQPATENSHWRVSHTGAARAPCALPRPPGVLRAHDPSWHARWRLFRRKAHTHAPTAGLRLTPHSLSEQHDER